MTRPTACRQRRWLALGGLMLGLLLTDIAAAGPPTYWTIGRQHPSGQVQPLHPQGYAYGWFGAAPRPQGARQMGYYGLYRQWSSY